MPLIHGKSKASLQKNIETEMKAHPDKKKQDIAIAYSVQRQAKKKKMAEGGKTDEMCAHGGKMHCNMGCYAYGGPADREDGNPGTPAPKKDNMRPEGYMGGEMTGKYAEGGMTGRYGGKSEDTGNPGTPRPKPDDFRPDEDEYMTERTDNGPNPPRKKDNMRPDGYMSGEMTGQFAEGGEIDSIARQIMNLRKRQQYYKDGGQVDIEENAMESGQSPYDEDNSEAYKKELYDDNMLSDQPLDSKGDDLEDEDEHSMIPQIRKKMKSRKGPRTSSPDDSELE